MKYKVNVIVNLYDGQEFQHDMEEAVELDSLEEELTVHLALLNVQPDRVSSFVLVCLPVNLDVVEEQKDIARLEQPDAPISDDAPKNDLSVQEVKTTEPVAERFQEVETSNTSSSD